MKTVRHSITIRAPREAVWDAMLGPETYRAWTAPFCEGSYYEGSWNTGDRIRFLGPGGAGGMTSVIAESRAHSASSRKRPMIRVPRGGPVPALVRIGRAANISGPSGSMRIPAMPSPVCIGWSSSSPGGTCCWKMAAGARGAPLRKS